MSFPKDSADKAPMKDDEVKAVIRCAHKIYYEGDIVASPHDALKFHKHMEVLFNWAGITATLCANNPGEVTPKQVEAMLEGNDEEKH